MNRVRSSDLDAIEGPELGPHGQGTGGDTQHGADGQVLIEAGGNLAQQARHAQTATQACGA